MRSSCFIGQDIAKNGQTKNSKKHANRDNEYWSWRNAQLHSDLQLTTTVILNPQRHDSAYRKQYHAKSNQNSTISSDPLLFSTIYRNSKQIGAPRKQISRNSKSLKAEETTEAKSNLKQNPERGSAIPN